MRTRSLTCIALSLVALSLLGAGDRLSPKEAMEFGVEAARRGLWREAAFRWERAVPLDPDNPRLRNNLAVAYESLGRLDEALAEYKEALRLDPRNKNIRANYESFRDIHRDRLEEEDDG